MNVSALSESVNSIDSQTLRDDLSTEFSDGRHVVYALTPKGWRCLRRRFGATASTVEHPCSISPFHLATLCDERDVRIEFDPRLDVTNGGDE
jgi:hypothetical protein